jgi:drug/metabolite transporter (DMT)-like permease
MTPYLKGILFVLLAGICWSWLGVIVRLVEIANTWQILFYRSSGLVPILFFYLGIKKNENPFILLFRFRLSNILGAFSLVTAYLGGIYAYQETTIANAAFLFAAAPLFTAVLAWPILKEPVRKATWLSIFLALIGISIMVQSGLSVGALNGNIAALLSALGFAGFTISLRWDKESEVLSMVVLAGILAILITGGILLVSNTGFVVPTNDLVLSGLVGASTLGCGMIFYTIGSRFVAAADLALLAMIEVILAPLWGWILLAELIGASNLVGGFLVLVSLVFNATTGVRYKPFKVI